MIGIVADCLGVSFKKTGIVTAEGFMDIGYKAVRVIDGRIPLFGGKFRREILVGDAVYVCLWGWHVYHTHFGIKRIFWCDTPISLEHIPDSAVDILNNYWCVVTVTRGERKRFEKRGIKTRGYVPRPLNKKAILKARKTEDDRFRKMFGKYVLFIGGDQILAPPKHPRKGLDRLDQAIGMIRSKLKSMGIRVIAHTNWPYFKNIEKLQAFYGGLSEDDIYQLIKQAELFVFPSRLEGFGVPPLEAMALGTLLVYTDVPTHKEFCVGIPVEGEYTPIREYAPEIGKYWVVYDYSPKALADAILYALDLPKSEKEEITSKAMLISENFFNDNVAQMLLKV